MEGGIDWNWLRAPAEMLPGEPCKGDGSNSDTRGFFGIFFVLFMDLWDGYKKYDKPESKQAARHAKLWAAGGRNLTSFTYE